MLSQEQIIDLYDECCIPYTEEEYELHSINRTLKSELEVEHAYNHEAIMITKLWQKYLKEGGEPPTVLIWRIIRPGKNLTNTRCIRLKAIFDEFAKYPHGECPVMPIVVYASRSAATLFDRLSKLYPSMHLEDVDFHHKELIALISNLQKFHLEKDQFVSAINQHVKALIDAINAYSYELGNYITGIMRQRERDAKATDTHDNKIIAEVRDDGKATRKHITNSTRTIISEVKKATTEFNEGCHHPDKEKDKLVQEVIKYLARPGVVFSINNACCKIVGKSRPGRCKAPWLYAWCHVHQTEIKDTVDILRTLNQ